MKTNAIIRIVLYSILALVLTGILLVALGINGFTFQTQSGSTVQGEAVIDTANIKDLDIDWAGGSITIQAADTDSITISESGNFDEKYAMVYQVKGKTLSIDYSKTSTISIGSSPSKDLTITVPSDWVCGAIDIDGADMDIQIKGFEVNEIDLDGADLELSFEGILSNLDCDGAACALDITCWNAPDEINIDGADCEIELTLPESCGFRAEMEGLGCTFSSDAATQNRDGCYVYGNEHCQIAADGLDCELRISHRTDDLLPTQPHNN